MYHTVEVRWFYPGVIPSDVQHKYLGADHPPAKQSSRVDIYLQMEDHDDLGIKIREGALEIKQRSGSFGRYIFNNNVSGFIEAWVKYRFELTHNPLDGLQSEKREDSWLFIRKTRWLRRYRLGECGEIIKAEPEEAIKRGCEWELSTVEVVGINEPWWSIAYEAFGDPTGLRQDLISVVEKKFLMPGERDFLAVDSLSYPGWLALFT